MNKILKKSVCFVNVRWTHVISILDTVITLFLKYLMIDYYSDETTSWLISSQACLLFQLRYDYI